MASPIRMCIVCRGRYEQFTLTRLQVKCLTLVPFTGEGRSFYLCKECIKNEKVVVKRLCHVLKTDPVHVRLALENLKEFGFNG